MLVNPQMQLVDEAALSVDPSFRLNGWAHPTRDMFLEAGYYEVPFPPPIIEGYERSPVTYAVVDGVCVPVYEDTLIQDRRDREAAAEQARIAEEFARNAERYVLENQYIILCDVLRQALGQEAAQAKIGFELLAPMMTALMGANHDAYEKLRDAMDMLNSALMRFDVRWWDSAVWHPEPELAEQSQAILALVGSA